MESQKPEIHWAIVEPSIWKPEKEDDHIEGVLVNKKEEVGVNKSNVYYVDNKEGTYMVWGSTVLDDRMTIVNVGDLIRITYKGVQPNKRGQDTKIFKVEQGKPADNTEDGTNVS
jgi:hypothetical protein